MPPLGAGPPPPAELRRPRGGGRHARPQGGGAGGVAAQRLWRVGGQGGPPVRRVGPGGDPRGDHPGPPAPVGRRHRHLRRLGSRPAGLPGGLARRDGLAHRRGAGMAVGVRGRHRHRLRHRHRPRRPGLRHRRCQSRRGVLGDHLPRRLGPPTAASPTRRTKAASPTCCAGPTR